MERQYYYNEIPIDYSIDLGILSNYSIANTIAQMMAGYHLVKNNRFYSWNGLVWEATRLDFYLYYFFNKLVKPMYIAVLEKQYPNCETIPPKVKNHIDRLLTTGLAAKIAKIVMGLPELQWTGEWNSNPNYIVYPDGLWDISIGGYIENSKQYYINKVNSNKLATEGL
jgi:hypothetical protein